MSRACSQQPAIGTSEKREGVEAIGKFVVLGGDKPERLKAMEESLDEVSCLGAEPVGFELGVAAITSRRDDRLGTAGLDDVNQGIDTSMNLGAQPAPRAPERLLPFFSVAPAAFGWARIIVLSMNTSSKSASCVHCAKT